MKISRRQTSAITAFVMLALVVGFVGGTFYREEQYNLELREDFANKNHVVINVVKGVQDDSLLANGWTFVGFTVDGRYHYQYVSTNVIVNAGQNWAQGQISGTPSASLKAVYIGLSESSSAPSYTDTTIPTELTANGLSRATGTYTSGTAASGDISWKVEYTWTASAAATVCKAGLFVTSGYNATPMYAENTFAAVTLASNDTISLTWWIVSSA